tara:strand:+ start:659 stop:871 length:213 start_codon:yes stop_codon:yes gene_type:complete
MEFRHPSYYKKLRASLKKEAISSKGSTDPAERAPEHQAASIKHQACEGTSGKHQAQSSKLQAPSRKQQAP